MDKLIMLFLSDDNIYWIFLLHLGVALTLATPNPNDPLTDRTGIHPTEPIEPEITLGPPGPYPHNHLRRDPIPYHTLLSTLRKSWRSIRRRHHPCDAPVSNALPRPAAPCLHLCYPNSLLGALHRDPAVSSMRDQKSMALCDSFGNPNHVGGHWIPWPI
jgi:hypothetical protein